MRRFKRPPIDLAASLPDNSRPAPVGISLEADLSNGTRFVSFLDLMLQQDAEDAGLIEFDSPAVDVSDCETIESVEQRERTPVAPLPIASAEAPVLYVATNLTCWETDSRRGIWREVVYDRVCYRRLDPEYYAWLRYKMDLAKKALESGGLDPTAFDELRIRFNLIHGWAVDRFGEDALHRAVSKLDPKTYSPPTVDDVRRDDSRTCPQNDHASDSAIQSADSYLHPKDGDWHFSKKVSSSTIAKVNAIRDHAISLGWNEARLYQNRGRFRFPGGEDYGLVCFINDNNRIGEVTAEYIEIIGPPPRGNRLRFYNPASDQSWIKKSVA